MADSGEPHRAIAGLVASPLLGQTIGDPDGSFVIAEWTDSGSESSADRQIAPLHIHYDDDEAWYVLEGTLNFRLGDDVVSAPAGAAVIGPRGLPHTYWNESEKLARYLIIMTPNTAKMIDELHTMPKRDFESVQALFRRYRCELV